MTARPPPVTRRRQRRARSGATRLQRADLPSPGRLLGYGLLAGLALIGALLAQQLLLGRTPFGPQGDWEDVWVAAVHCLLATYLPAALLAILAGYRQVERQLRTGEAGRARVPLGGALIWAALVGLALGFLGPWLTEPHRGAPTVFWASGDWSPEVYWHRLGGVWILVWFSWYTAVILRLSGRLAARAGAMPVHDLFHPDPFLPFLRQGFLQALATAGAVALIGLVGLDEGLTLMLFIFGGGGILVTAAAGLLPLLGVKRRLSAARAAEVAWCDAALARERGRLRGPRPPDAPGRLADLVAYGSLVQRVNPWLIDLPAVRRFVLYLLIPLLSWIGSGVVQELVQQSMNRP